MVLLILESLGMKGRKAGIQEEIETDCKNWRVAERPFGIMKNITLKPKYETWEERLRKNAR